MKSPLLIKAQSVADFRAQLDAAIAEAQRVAGVPVLPTTDEGDGDDAALVAALADVVQSVCVESVVQSPKSTKSA